MLWGGVVDQPETVATSYGPMEVLSRVLPDGEYTWVIEAVDDQGEHRSTGAITLQDGATTLPELHNFEVVPDVFRPNQDGLRDDWVSISYYLNKDVNDVVVFVEDPAQPGVRLPSSPKSRAWPSPTNRVFTNIGTRAASISTRSRRPTASTISSVRPGMRPATPCGSTPNLTIVEGGKPRADVAQGEIDWAGEVNRVVSVPLGESLCFTAVVTNESAVPIRTTGPWPGQEYRFSENYNTLAGRGQRSLVSAGWRLALRDQLRHHRDRLSLPLGHRPARRFGAAYHRRPGAVVPAAGQVRAGERLHRHGREAARGHDLLVGRVDPRIRERRQ